MAPIKLGPGEIKLIIEVVEELIGFLISRTTLTLEEQERLIKLKSKLNDLRSKEQRIADGQ